MTAVAVRHNRPKHLADGKLRPTNLNLLKTSGLGPGHGPGGTDSPGKLSAAPSRAGSPSHETGGGLGQGDKSMVISVRYGDECFYNKVSLLHFIVFFLLGGLTLTVVGAVQFKSEAGLGHLKHHFLAAGGVLLVAGLLLLIVKCACFRKPKYQGPDEDSNTTKGLGGGGSKMPSRQQSPVHSSSHSATVGIQGGGGQQASNQSQIAGGKPNRNEAVHTHLNENVDNKKAPPLLSITPASDMSNSAPESGGGRGFGGGGGRQQIIKSPSSSTSHHEEVVALSNKNHSLTNSTSASNSRHVITASSKSIKAAATTPESFPLNSV